MGMVKADAYGHGILEISSVLLREGVEYLGVAYIEEAKYLRDCGIKSPILVVGPTNHTQLDDFIHHHIEITCASLEKAKQISDVAAKYRENAKIHLKIDTGMERIGVHWYNAEKFIEEAASLPYLEIKGVFSHFAKAEDDATLTIQQIKRFDRVIHFMDRHRLLPELVHLANSAGTINYPEAHYNMVRPGIILYGYMDALQSELKPVMTLKTKVSFFKVVPQNTGISYCHTYTTQKQTRIVTLPIGYGDGYRRHFSNTGEVIIRGKRYPVAGNVCMDQLMVDIGPDGIAYNGDDVLLFGESGVDQLPLDDLAARINTIPYEILCGISGRVPRIYEE
jgi:alanine racemase